MSTTKYSPTLLRIAVAGDVGVGKTSICKRYLQGKVPRAPRSTVGSDFSTKDIIFKETGDKVKLLLWDLAGEQKYRPNRNLYFQGIYGCVIVFDMFQINSFQNILSWVEDIVKYTNTKGVPIIIVGNKSDLLKIEQRDPEEMEVYNLIAKIKNKYENNFPITYIETSAFTGEGITEVFTTIIDSALTWKKQMS